MTERDGLADALSRMQDAGQKYEDAADTALSYAYSAGAELAAGELIEATKDVDPETYDNMNVEEMRGEILFALRALQKRGWER